MSQNRKIFPISCGINRWSYVYMGQKYKANYKELEVYRLGMVMGSGDSESHDHYI